MPTTANSRELGGRDSVRRGHALGEKPTSIGLDHKRLMERKFTVFEFRVGVSIRFGSHHIAFTVPARFFLIRLEGSFCIVTIAPRLLAAACEQRCTCLDQCQLVCFERLFLFGYVGLRHLITK